ncbi:hypothetical protein GWK47_011832 [Chionoecetes opilio]|uniref:Uncharacterized protein n=1 Tax=Chionoecetes opilio TaxID=41210 RepID=A0A8J5CMT3_CHIOP|nr:hypothetical protein GWK47_011832 [Chionoecetes opilio]
MGTKLGSVITPPETQLELALVLHPLSQWPQRGPPPVSTQGRTPPKARGLTKKTPFPPGTAPFFPQKTQTQSGQHASALITPRGRRLFYGAPDQTSFWKQQKPPQDHGNAPQQLCHYTTISPFFRCPQKTHFFPFPHYPADLCQAGSPLTLKNHPKEEMVEETLLYRMETILTSKGMGKQT